MQNLFKNFINLVLNSLKDVLLFLSDYLSRDNGIRSLYLVVLLIPSLCLLYLYYNERQTNIMLVQINKNLQNEANQNYKLYITAKDSLRATVFKEYIELSKAMNELQESLNNNNDEKTKKILNYTNKVNV